MGAKKSTHVRDIGLTQLTGIFFCLGEAKCGVDFQKGIIAVAWGAKIFERSNKTYNLTHQPPIVTIA